MNDRERIAELEAQVERLERSLARTQDLRRDAVAARAAETDKLRQSRKQLEQLRGRRAVRMALDLSNRSRPIAGTVRRLRSSVRLGLRAVRPGGRATTASLRRSPEAEREVAAAIRRDLAPAVLERGPLVSVVILNRDGRDLLERCLRAVATTFYRDVEVIVVDNGSTDGSADLAESLALRSRYGSSGTRRTGRSRTPTIRRRQSPAGSCCASSTTMSSRSPRAGSATWSRP